MNEMTGNGMAVEEATGGTAARARLQSIIAMQMDGRVQEAHDAYVSYFEQHEIDYPALNMFGICCMALGRFDKASGLFQHIVQNAPMIDEAALYLAECHIELSDADAALAVLQPVCKGAADDHKPHLLAARAHILKDNKAAAIDCLETAGRLASEATDILLLLATLHLACLNTEAALEIYGRILFDDPQNIDALLGQSDALIEDDCWEEILVNADLVLEQQPEHQRARYLHCSALSKLKKFDLMLISAKAMALTAPENPLTLEKLAEAYLETGDNHSALLCAKNLLEQQPRSGFAHKVAASAFFRLGKYKDALESNSTLLRCFPNDIQAMENLAVVLDRLNRTDEALEAFDRVLAKCPDRKSAKFNKSISLLLKGELKEGLRLYENRFDPTKDMVPFYLGDEPIWDGREAIESKHLLIHPEQGLGDTLMCCRFIKHLEDCNANLTFAVQPALASVMETLESSAEIIKVGEDINHIDLHVPLMSLAHLTYEKWAHSSVADAYLDVPKDVQSIWMDRLGKKSKFRVGFACSGNPKHSNDAGRSINMRTFLDSLPQGPEYHLLQKDLRDTDLAALRRYSEVIRHDHEISDFADTAALCSNMDLIVSVDTSIAHLAGALGKRTFLMLAWWPDWRWGLKRHSNLWYSNMVSLRQQTAGDWSHLLSQLNIKIRDEMGKAL